MGPVLRCLPVEALPQLLLHRSLEDVGVLLLDTLEVLLEGITPREGVVLETLLYVLASILQVEPIYELVGYLLLELLV